MSIALIDFDSVLYESVYRIVSFRQIKDALNKFGKEGAKQWLLEEVYNEGLNRAENQLLKMQNYLDDIFFDEIESYEIFITTCENSFRKSLCSTYKANRKKNPYVFLLREHYRHNNAFSHQELEADDLISIRAKELGVGNYVIVSLDKDLKQIGGYYWSYYKIKSKDMDGNFIFDDYDNHVKEYRQKQVEFISLKKAEYLFWLSMLMGDASDNIKGLHRVGEKTAEKILADSTVHWIRVAREYIKRKQKQDFKINYQLLKLK